MTAYDTITPRLLKESASAISGPLDRVNERIDQKMQISLSMENGAGNTSFKKR